MGKIIAITNRKGGTGKTFTCASLAVGLARQGKKVLCLDADSQRSLTISLGVREPEKLPSTIVTIIHDIINKNEIDPEAGIVRHTEGIDLLPANSKLTGIDLALAPIVGREIVIKKYLSKVAPLYDYCLIDTSPTFDLLTINALVAADTAIIPVAPEFLDAKGLELLLMSIAEIREFLNPSLDICGILLTMVDFRTNHAKDMASAIEEAYGEKIRVFNEHIPHAVKAKEASATGKSIFTHDPKGKVAASYATLAREVLEVA
jgi:chromosome partitioning protein